MGKIAAVAGSGIVTNILGFFTLLAAAYGIFFPPVAPQTHTTTSALAGPQGTRILSTGHPILFGITALVGLALFLPSWIALFSHRAKRYQISMAVDSPLFRRENGALDWKPIQYEQIANKAFVNAEIALDGKRYIDCTFEHCTFVYEGGAPGELIGDKSALIRRNLNEINFTLRSGNPIVMTAWQLQYKVGQGAPGMGMRFEPKN